MARRGGRDATEETLDPFGGPRVAPAEDRVPTLTVIWHPDPAQVGAWLELPKHDSGVEMEISRSSPAFHADGTDDAGPLLDRGISRKPLVLKRERDGRTMIVRGEHGSEIAVAGQAMDLADRAVIDEAQLERGVTIELAGRVALLLQRRVPRAKTPARPHFGMVGHAEAIERVRDAVARVADLDVPVLLTGESGSGKELVARAIHVASARAQGPLVSVNVAAVPPTTAASELFGHVRGSFTGATRDHEGCFERATAGTLFLDEIGEVPGDVQAMLLRALETSEVQPVGASGVKKVDVRLIAATDRDLEAAVRRGEFRAALLHRLGGFPIRVPSLRERREDVGRLLLSFLREELLRLGEPDRLAPRGEGEPPWLGAAFVAALARLPWPGNVRQLRNVARQVAIASRGENEARIDGILESLYAGEADTDPGADARSDAHTAAASDAPVKRKPADIGDEDLVTTLRANGWRVGPTARALGISKSSLYDRIDKSSAIKKAKDLDRATIEAAIADAGAGAKPETIAAKLEVSPRGLQLRMKELGIE